MEHDPFWYGVAISVVGALMLLLRAVRGKAYSKVQGVIAIALIVLGAGVSFGFLGRMIEPIMAFLGKFAS